MMLAESSSPPDVLAVAAAEKGIETTLDLYYGGGWHAAATGASFESIEPATGRPLARVADGGPQDLAAALDAAEAGSREWASVPARRRGELAIELAQRVLAESRRFALLDARDNGSPVGAMLADAKKGAASLMSAGGLATQIRGDTFPVGPGHLNFTVLRPWGVVARIIAFNHPTTFACARLGSALVAGNAVILKPSELAPLAALALAQLAHGLLPPGVLSVLTGGPALGAAIARSPRIRRLSFTGSVATGLKVSQEAAESGIVKTVTLELGGKNPIIVCEDADIEAAAGAVVRGMNFSRVQGQSCGSTSRLLVHDRIHDELLGRVAEAVGRIRLGLPTDESAEMGSLINRAAQQRTLGFVTRAVTDGARLVAGGHAPSDPHLKDGAFVAPTILDDVSIDSELAQEEVFGPVLAVMRWTDESEVVGLANRVRYGLTASIWTQDIDRAFRLAEAIEAGYIWVNDIETRYPSVPFGGWKDSGSGLEDAVEELLSFTRTKAINLAFRDS